LIIIFSAQVVHLQVLSWWSDELLWWLLGGNGEDGEEVGEKETTTGALSFLEGFES